MKLVAEVEKEFVTSTLCDWEREDPSDPIAQRTSKLASGPLDDRCEQSGLADALLFQESSHDAESEQQRYLFGTLPAQDWRPGVCRNKSIA